MNDFIDTQRVWLEVDLDAISHTGKIIRQELLPPQTKIMAVLKSDAYGLGATYLATYLEEKELVDWFAVACISEAISLRKSGVTKPILILGHTSCCYASLLATYKLTQTVGSLEYALALHQELIKHNQRIDIHLKINTGMNRLGFDYTKPQDESSFLHEILTVLAMTTLCSTGMYSHLCTSLSYTAKDKEMSIFQAQNFMKAKELLEKYHGPLEYYHLCNTGGAINYPKYAFDMIRVGSLLWGLCGVTPDISQRITPHFPTTIQMKSKVVMTRTLKPSDYAGYAFGYQAQKETDIAIVSCGYTDGFSRSQSNQGFVLIHGQKAKVIGKVCMDSMMIDISGIKDVKIGDIVTIFGNDGNLTITCGQVAQNADMIEPEVTTLIGRRVPRMYYENKTLKHIENFL